MCAIFWLYRKQQWYSFYPKNTFPLFADILKDLTFQIWIEQS